MCANTRESRISAHNASLLTDLTGKKKLIVELSIANVQDSEIARRAQTTIGYVWKVKSELRKAGLLSGAALRGPDNLPRLEDLKLEELEDEELKELASQLQDAKRRAEASRLKYLARKKKDMLEAEAARYARMLEEHEVLSDPEKLAIYAEKVLAEHPAELSEMKQRIEELGLTLEEALPDELEITADDYKCCREISLAYTGKPYRSLAEHLVGRVKAWLKDQKLGERKAKLKPYLDSHYPVCPKCGRKYLEGTESGIMSCNICGWRGQLNFPRIGPHSVGWIVPILTYEKVVYCLVPPRIDDVRPGDRVEAYGLVVEGPALAIQCEGYLIKLGPSGPPDIVVVGVWVTPRNPQQEDMVSFGAEIANIGGADAYGFRVEAHLDGYLWDSGTASVSAGSSITLTSDRQYRAEDGSHEVRWIGNSDRSIEESNYGNNEGSASFFVSPRTVTLTEHATVTRTKTQTEKHTQTVTVTRTVIATRTMDTTVRSTVTAKAVTVTQTLSGLVTSTIYSPTVTTTVTVAQIISNPLPLVILGTVAGIGAALRLPNNSRLKRYYQKVAAAFLLSELLTWLTRAHVRKALSTICLLSVIVLSISSQASQLAVASTVTVTRTVTDTEWTTLTQSLTSTRYVTSIATDTSTFTRTKTGLTTTTPTITVAEKGGLRGLDCLAYLHDCGVWSLSIRPSRICVGIV